MVMVPIEEPDPLWDMKITNRKMSRANRDLFFQGSDPETTTIVSCGVYEQAGGQPNHVGAGGHYTCTRPVHPPHWRHIATGGYRGDVEAIAMWGGTKPSELATEPMMEDPDPGEFDLEIGQLYKFRNRPTVLMYLGPRKGKRVEVLDLTHERYRVLAVEQLVPRPAAADPVTPHQLQWVARFMAERRNKTRETAIDQRREGRFNSKADLDKVLLELHLEPTVQVAKGYVQVTMRISGRTDPDVRTKMTDWLQNLPPLPAGVRLDKPVTEIAFRLDTSEG